MNRTLNWQFATVQSIRQETPRTKTLTLTLPDWSPHRAGQHYDIRLTAPDGYQAERSYSIASEPERVGTIDLTVERIENGEVSTYLHDVVLPGDQIEVRGPIGGYFVWEASMAGPLLLIAGGSGIVPLMAMVRHRNASHGPDPARLLYSSRAFEDIIYYEELEKLRLEKSGFDVFYTLTRDHPQGWPGYTRRIDDAILREVIAPLGNSLRAYVCGPTLLVESVANSLVGCGLQPQQIRTERFGPTGGLS